jgi:hypothetical protein
MEWPTPGGRGAGERTSSLGGWSVGAGQLHLRRGRRVTWLVDDMGSDGGWLAKDDIAEEPAKRGDRQGSCQRKRKSRVPLFFCS